MPSKRILVAEQVFDENRISAQAGAWQIALERAYQSTRQVQCLCAKPPLRLGIRLDEGKYQVALWPNEGLLHDMDCVFFRGQGHYDALQAMRLAGGADDAPSAQGAAATTGHASAAAGASGEQSTEPPLWRMKLALSLDRADNLAPFAASPNATGSTGTKSTPSTTSGPPFSLEDLLKTIWVNSQLGQWHPSWRRDWGFARNLIYRFAETVEIQGHRLSERLYVPRRYDPNQQGRIEQEWEAFIQSIAPKTNDRMPAGLILAPVKRISSIEGDQLGLHLRHMRAPIGLTGEVRKDLERDCRMAWARMHVISDADRTRAAARGQASGHAPQGMDGLSEVIVLALVEMDSRQGLWARAAWAMQVHPALYLPAGHPAELALVEALAQQGHQFERNLLPGNQRHAYADWTIRQVLGPAGEPRAQVALEVLGGNVSPAWKEKRMAMIQRLSAQDVPTWVWQLPPTARNGQRQPGRLKVPPLPPSGRLSQVQAMEQLHAIKRSAEVTYPPVSAPDLLG